MPQREAGARPDLGLEARRQGEPDAAWHQRAAHGSQHHGLRHRRKQIEPGGTGVA